MERYENFNLQNYTDMVTENLILTNPDNMELKIKLQELTGNLQNPYIDLYHWSKGEIFDLQAVMFSVKTRNDCEKQIRELEKKKQSTQRDLQDVSAGNKTVSTLFKSSSDASEMANKIESLEKEIESMQKLTDLLTIFVSDNVLTKFKREKLGLYNRILSSYQVMEIANAHAVSGFWAKVLAIDKVKAAAGGP